ncbi:cell division septation protein DedD [Sphingomonas vulcanisoli]|uniref:Cell division septation protein DedD n=1 Tax=Sphingomonas vulcanisoli TaxID=1658060 RepID=A0ABX0TRC5_9SPHN|nr:SPOR domain-containing protein [Sphingomonas vulcanisoli]NIJ08001.1 cell division septation protein DedD [Sphingomonas vulcanisoli]
MRRLLAIGMLMAGIAQAQGWQPYSPALVASAQAGDPAAQYALGEAYRSGNGVQADREQALSWFKKAAPNDTRAADALGVLLFVKGERKQAVPLLQAASQRGNAQALYILGTARFNGDYVPKDIGAAYAEMRLAAQKGLPEAQRSLQLMEPYVDADARARADQLAAQPAGPETGALPVPPPPVARAAAPPVRTVKTPYVAATPSVAPVASATTSAADPIPPVSTGPAPLATIELPPSAPTAAAPIHTASAPVTGGWRVQLAAVASPAAAESEWVRLKRKAPDLAALDHAAVPSGSMTRLQAVGIASKAEASALCQKLVAAGLGCFVVAPSS